MGLFNNINKSEIVELEERTSENIKREIINVKKQFTDENNKLKEKDMEISKEIALLLDRIKSLEDQILCKNVKVIEKNDDVSNSEDDDITNLTLLCREVNIKDFTSTLVKYYLYENGIYDMTVNEFRNSFVLKQKFDDNTNTTLAKLVHVDGKKITFSKDIVDYIKNDSDNVKRLVESYKNKNKVYKKSKENISKGLVNNYREEIKSICGTSSGERWIEIYKMFSKTFPNFLKDYTKYVHKHRGEDKYDISKVRYVVDVMNQGNVLLKIACELYVN